VRESRVRTAVILDAHPLWLEAMENLLIKLGLEVLATTTSPDVALTLVEEHSPDVLVAEVGLQEREADTLDCVRRARQQNRDLKIVLMSDDNQQHQIEAGFAAGASVFCVKTVRPDDLAAAIRQSFEHSIYFAHTPVATETVAPPAESSSPANELTRRELEILQLVAEGHSNSQLAKMLWVTEQTVKFHLSNVYRKLGVSNRTEASRWAQLNGLLADARDAATAAA